MSFLYFYKWLFGAENVLGLSINAPQDSAAIKSTPSEQHANIHITIVHPLVTAPIKVAIFGMFSLNDNYFFAFKGILKLNKWISRICWWFIFICFT